jgi:hypothetical protein
LLAHVDGHGGAVEAVEDLQDAGIDALRAVAGEGFFGDDVRLHPRQIQARLEAAVAAQISHGPAFLAKAPSVVFVDIHADVQSIEVAQQDQGHA